MLAKKADVDRIYLPCQEGGRSLMNVEKEYKATMVGLHKYMMNKNPQIQAVTIHQTAKPLHSIPKEAEAYLTEAGTKISLQMIFPSQLHGKPRSQNTSIKKMSINW